MTWSVMRGSLWYTLWTSTVKTMWHFRIVVCYRYKKLAAKSFLILHILRMEASRFNIFVASHSGPLSSVWAQQNSAILKSRSTAYFVLIYEVWFLTHKQHDRTKTPHNTNESSRKAHFGLKFLQEDFETLKRHCASLTGVWCCKMDALWWWVWCQRILEAHQNVPLLQCWCCGTWCWSISPTGQLQRVICSVEVAI